MYMPVYAFAQKPSADILKHPTKGKITKTPTIIQHRPTDKHMQRNM
jgi:hypothetical protein